MLVFVQQICTHFPFLKFSCYRYCQIMHACLDPGQVIQTQTWAVYQRGLPMMFQVIRLNGGEYPNAAGMFNGLLQVTQEQWDTLESLIRSVKGS